MVVVERVVMSRASGRGGRCRTKKEVGKKEKERKKENIH